VLLSHVTILNIVLTHLMAFI